MLIVEDRVKELSNSVGIGNFALIGVAASFKSFDSVCNINDTFYYSIIETSGANWEIGIGTYLGSSIIQRTTVTKSSISNTRVNFQTGLKDVFITVSSEALTIISETGSKTILGRKESNIGNVQQLSVNDINTMIRSNNVENRLNIDINGGLYVPELETDPLAFYILAKA